MMKVWDGHSVSIINFSIDITKTMSLVQFLVLENT